MFFSVAFPFVLFIVTTIFFFSFCVFVCFRLFFPPRPFDLRIFDCYYFSSSCYFPWSFSVLFFFLFSPYLFYLVLQVRAVFGKDPRQYSVMTKEFLSDGEGNVRGLVTVNVEVTKDGIKVRERGGRRSVFFE